ncbi:MAG: DUF4858 domain-containing protein [Bacteroides sp.]|nr:DUF4858 domain-containing protein [Bacteroides sp.]
MVKRLFLGILLSVWAWTLHAQWERKDSLRLQELLQGQEEIRLNPQAVKEIDRKQIGAPMMERRNNVLEFDLTLPEVLPERKKIILTLSPYKPNTRFNYDPIEQKKIKVGKDTWRGDQQLPMSIQLIYANWAKKPYDPQYRESVEQIEATGMRYNMLANGGQGQWEKTGKPTGYDFMTPFTKDFWDKKGKQRRARTLEVLRHYGDSTTIQVREEIIKPVIK